MLSNNGSCETNSKLPQGFGNYLSNEGYVQVIFPKTLFNHFDEKHNYCKNFLYFCRDSNTWAIIQSSTQVDCVGEYSYFDINGIWMKSVPELVPLNAEEKPKVVQPGYKNLSSSVEILPHSIGVFSGEVSNGIIQSLLYPIYRQQAIDSYTNQYMKTTSGFLDERMNKGITARDGMYSFFNGLLDEVWIGMEYYAKICLAALGVAYLTWQVNIT